MERRWFPLKTLTVTGERTLGWRPPQPETRSSLRKKQLAPVLFPNPDSRCYSENFARRPWWLWCPMVPRPLSVSVSLLLKSRRRWANSSNFFFQGFPSHVQYQAPPRGVLAFNIGRPQYCIQGFLGSTSVEPPSFGPSFP